jgi:hypothetical protein
MTQRKTRLSGRQFNADRAFAQSSVHPDRIHQHEPYPLSLQEMEAIQPETVKHDAAPQQNQPDEHRLS